MVYPDRATVCVSSQAGCAMGCSFCATGQGGFDRHLSVGEIVEQVVTARREALPRRLGNVVFMGMGEPLANYDRTWSAVERIHSELGISARHITLSTVGVVPGHPPSGHRGAPGQPGRLPARRPRRAAQQVGPAQPALPAVSADGCVRGVPGGQGPAALVRVGAHRRRQRHPPDAADWRSWRCRWGRTSTSSRSTRPAGMPAGEPAAGVAGFGMVGRASGSTPPSGPTGAPTSTLRVASWLARETRGDRKSPASATLKLWPILNGSTGANPSRFIWPTSCCTSMRVLAALSVEGAAFFGVLALPPIFAGLGIANEKKAGYWGGVVVAALNLLVLLASCSSAGPPVIVIINLLFAAPCCLVTAPCEPQLRAGLVQEAEQAPLSKGLAGRILYEGAKSAGKRASTNSWASNGTRSSGPSPRPTSLIGIPSSLAIATAIPPLAVPSSFVRTTPVTPTASVN